LYRTDSERTKSLPEYCRNPNQLNVKHAERGKPYKFSKQVDT